MPRWDEKNFEDKTPHPLLRRENIESNIYWVLWWTALKNESVSLFNSVWRMCGRLVGGVGPKMKSCYLLRVKQRLAFCCPLLPNKLFSVFWKVRLLPGVLVCTCSTGETYFATRLCGICLAKHENGHSGRENPVWQPSVWLKNVHSAMV